MVSLFFFFPHSSQTIEERNNLILKLNLKEVKATGNLNYLKKVWGYLAGSLIDEL